MTEGCGTELLCAFTEKPRPPSGGDPVFLEEVIPGIIQQFHCAYKSEKSHIINGFDSSYRQEPGITLRPVKLLRSFRFAAKSVLVGPGSQLSVLLSNINGILLAPH